MAANLSRGGPGAGSGAAAVARPGFQAEAAAAVASEDLRKVRRSEVDSKPMRRILPSAGPWGQSGSVPLFGSVPVLGSVPGRIRSDTDRPEDNGVDGSELWV